MNQVTKSTFILLLSFWSVLGWAQAPIAKYSGNGMKNTRPFTVDGPWEVKWNASGNLFQVMVFDIQGNLVDAIANQTGPGKGSSYQTKQGKYYLKINAIGNWTLAISKGGGSTTKTTNTSGLIGEYTGNGNKNLRPFNVDKPWEVSWEAKGMLFQLMLFDMSGNLVGVLANQTNAGKNSSYQVKTGKYYIKVNAVGSWKMKIKYAK